MFWNRKKKKKEEGQKMVITEEAVQYLHDNAQKEVITVKDLRIGSYFKFPFGRAEVLRLVGILDHSTSFSDVFLHYEGVGENSLGGGGFALFNNSEVVLLDIFDTKTNTDLDLTLDAESTTDTKGGY